MKACRIPAALRLGEEGDGFKIAMATLDVFRSTVGAAALGFARRAMDETVEHVRNRKLFGAPLAALQMTQAKVAQMAVDIDASALLVYRAAHAKDAGAARVTREAAMAKWYATEAASRVADAAVQLFGGRGVTRGEAVERIYRDVRALRIYEGASEIQQVVIARSVLEARRCRSPPTWIPLPPTGCRRARSGRIRSSRFPNCSIPIALTAPRGCSIGTRSKATDIAAAFLRRA